LKILPLLLLAFFAWGCAATTVPGPESSTVEKSIKAKKKSKKKKVAQKKKKKKNSNRVKNKPVEPDLGSAAGTIQPAEQPEIRGDQSGGDGDEDSLVVGRMMFHYDYYPDVDVYFDTIRHLYFYKDGGKWLMSVALPTLYQKNAGSSVRLKLKTDRPFTQHDEHRKLYPKERVPPGF